MAEYIEKQQARIAVDKRIAELKDDSEFNYAKAICINGVKEHINSIAPADVVERKKYDLLQQGYETLKHQLEESWNRIDELDKINGDMWYKIDKAIKEMEKYSTFFKYTERHDLAGAVDYCIGVIKKEIGVEE